jgi:hypothetical protein
VETADAEQWLPGLPRVKQTLEADAPGRAGTAPGKGFRTGGETIRGSIPFSCSRPALARWPAIR